MRILIAAVGRAKRGPARDIYDHYAKRLRWPLALKEIEARPAGGARVRQQREAEALLRAVPKGATLIALDEGGKTLASAEFAAMIAKARDGGVDDLVFAIGGADGHAGALLERADEVLSFGPMTWPHLLVRGMLTEQLYRAQQILSHHPYHRE
jgi:23S rRNA (pseudouridine1915-N3)-methyltransferase